MIKNDHADINMNQLSYTASPPSFFFHIRDFRSMLDSQILSCTSFRKTVSKNGLFNFDKIGQGRCFLPLP